MSIFSIVYHTKFHTLKTATFAFLKKKGRVRQFLSGSKSIQHNLGSIMAAKKSTTKEPRPIRENEQKVYIGPDENITAVRQRLEHIESQYVVLIVPPQTRLRGQVVWKLLSARAKELGKEISIVSTDPQIRALARSVRFDVAS